MKRAKITEEKHFKSSLVLPRKTPRYQRVDSYVINGRDAEYGEFPYMASLQDSSFGFDYPICGGAVYNDKFILTAAHCVNEENADDPSYLKVYAGDYSLSDIDGNEQIVPISEFIIHEDFNKYSMFNDIALLRLQSPLNYTTYVQPIFLPSEEQQSSGDCTLTGWGQTSNGQAAKILQAVSLPIVSDEDCRDVYGNYDVQDDMVCAGGSGSGGCNGDSGSPLVCNNAGQLYIAGIGSWGYECATAGFPSVFTEVSYFIDWILQNTT
ncbi:Trypsin-1 [Armadillidium vulgare]|nr:Trypsin-1 [Armadillidium vulgare]